VPLSERGQRGQQDTCFVKARHVFRQGDLEEGCGERPQHARAHHGAVPLCSQVTSRRAGKRFKQAFVRLSNGCNRVTWDEDDGGGKLSLDLNQVMTSDGPLMAL